MMRSICRLLCRPVSVPILALICVGTGLRARSSELRAASEASSEPRVTLHARGIMAGELVTALAAGLKAEIRLEGDSARRATVELDEAPAVHALDRVAAALGGRWQPVIRVAPGVKAAPSPNLSSQEPGARSQEPVTFRLGRTVTLRLRGTGIAPALAAVARAAGARLELSPELTGTVFLEAQDLPVEEALDRLAAQVEFHWRMGYLLILEPAPSLARTTEESPPAAPYTPPVSLTPPPVPGRPRAPLASRGGPTPAMLRQLLTVELAQVLRAPPRSRGAAVHRYATRLERALRGLEPLPPLERTRRLAPLRGLFRSGLRAFGGLTPDQQRDFRPVEELLRRWMP